MSHERRTPKRKAEISAEANKPDIKKPKVYEVMHKQNERVAKAEAKSAEALYTLAQTTEKTKGAKAALYFYESAAGLGSSKAQERLKEFEKENESSKKETETSNTIAGMFGRREPATPATPRDVRAERRAARAAETEVLKAVNPSN